MHIPLLLAAAAVVVADTTTIINPSTNWGTWAGWATSLAWWAKEFGVRDDLADIFFTTQMAAYNGTNSARSRPQYSPLQRRCLYPQLYQRRSHGCISQDDSPASGRRILDRLELVTPLQRAGTGLWTVISGRCWRRLAIGVSTTSNCSAIVQSGGCARSIILLGQTRVATTCSHGMCRTIRCI
jgi:hypothetical protein